MTRLQSVLCSRSGVWRRGGVPRTGGSGAMLLWHRRQLAARVTQLHAALSVHIETSLGVAAVRRRLAHRCGLASFTERDFPE